MSEYEIYSLWVQSIGVIVAVFVLLVAVWGERIRQMFNHPQLNLTLLSPDITDVTLKDSTGRSISCKGWFFKIQVSNSKVAIPARETRLMITKVFSQGTDGQWRQQMFSSPSQVMWQWDDIPRYTTIGGAAETATFGQYINAPGVPLQFNLKLYGYPNNLIQWSNITAGGRLRYEFQAFSETARSTPLLIEVATDGTFTEARDKIGDHCNVRKIE